MQRVVVDSTHSKVMLFKDRFEQSAVYSLRLSSESNGGCRHEALRMWMSFLHKLII